MFSTVNICLQNSRIILRNTNFRVNSSKIVVVRHTNFLSMKKQKKTRLHDRPFQKLKNKRVLSRDDSKSRPRPPAV